MKQSVAGAGSTAKHAGTTKTSSTAAGKHAPSKPPVQTIRVVGSGHVTVTVKMPKPPKPRGLALGDAWACCSAEALGASLRLAGGRVSQDDVLALHVAAGGTRDRGVPVLAALRAASVHGLADARPRWFGALEPGRDLVSDSDDRRLPLDGLTNDPGHAQPHVIEDPFIGAGEPHGASVILGLELPGAHAVTVGSDGRWLSWGGCYDPADWPDAVIEEAWAVAW